MSYVVVKDFRQGQDGRRLPVSGEPGSLVELTDGHISRGGEIESRKAFVNKWELPPGETHGLHTAGGNVFLFGHTAKPDSVPGIIRWKQLEHIDGNTAMLRILDTDNFDGKIYAIAEFVDGSVFHYYNGKRIKSWDAIGFNIFNIDDVAEALKNKIGADEFYDTEVLANILTITANEPGVEFTIEATAKNLGSVNDQKINLKLVQENVEETDIIPAEGSFKINDGVNGDTINFVKVDGVNILNKQIIWTHNNNITAGLVALQININTDDHGFTATSSDISRKVTIIAPDGEGAATNEDEVTVDVTGGAINITEIVDMENGADLVEPIAQVYKAIFKGTYEEQDRWTITLDDVPYTVSGAEQGIGHTVKTHKSKVYSEAESLLRFSSLNAPTQWGSGIGFGFINMSNNDGGSEHLNGIGIFQGNMAVFSETTIQIWLIDQDEDANQLLQTLSNTGALAPKAIASFGDADVFYLSHSGVRSLRARNTTNSAFSSDVGNAVDSAVADHLKTLTDEQIQNAVAILEPQDGRYWLSLGEKMFVFSFFPGSKISAWSTYNVPEFSEFAIANGRVYARSGDTIYLYGGDDNDEYTDPETNPVIAQLPFLDAGRVATKKDVIGFDAATEGRWKVELLVDPNNLAARTPEFTIEGVTYSEGAIPAEENDVSHVAPRLVSQSTGKVVLSSLAVHFKRLPDE